MTTTEQLEHKVDRTGWPPGPWDQEPDRIEWTRAGLACRILRDPLGYLCGYVGLPPGHPMHGWHHDKVDAPVHRGLSYSASSAEGGTWWLGFACFHAGDGWPSMGPALLAVCTYRDLAYVIGEVNDMADALAAIVEAGRADP